MKRLSALLVLSLLFSCNEEEIVKDPELKQTQGDYIIFGTYFGFCAGDDCISIYKKESDKLLEDVKKEYPSQEQPYQGEFVPYTGLKLLDFNNLLPSLPAALLTTQDTVIGCPDCADGGGIYLEYKSGNTHRFWLIDRMVDNVPAELRDFVLEIDATVESLKE